MVFVRKRLLKLDHRFRLYAVAENTSTSLNSNGLERRRSWTSWVVNSNSAVNGFAGWNADEKSGDTPPRQSLQGIVAAGIAGVLLMGGLTFISLAIGKRSSSRLNQQMEPLTSQQEQLLLSDDNNTRIDKDTHETQNDLIEQSREGNLILDDTHQDFGLTNIGPNQQYFKIESSTDHISVDHVTLPKPPDSQISNASNSIDEDAYVASQKQEPFSDPGGSNLVTNSSLVNDHVMNLKTDEQLSGMVETINPNSPDLPPGDMDVSFSSQSEAVLEPHVITEMPTETTGASSTENLDIHKTEEVLTERNEASPSGTTVSSGMEYKPENELGNVYENMNGSRSKLHPINSGNGFISASIPAPSTVSTALLTAPGKVLIPATVDEVQGQAFAALQALKVIEADVQPVDLCTRREYARWLVSASSALSRSTVSKVYPAMYIENVTELAFDDITPEDPDFPSIQGLAEAGLIFSKLSRRDMHPSLDDDLGPLCFSPESPLSRQDLVSWKIALEKKQLPIVDRKNLQQISGFIDLDKIDPDAWPSLAADLRAGEQGIIALAFGYTRLFQPHKPVTKAQAAIALATGEASDFVSEELVRIEAETMAENVVTAQNALVALVEKDVNALYETELQLEREKVNAVAELAEEAKRELDRLRAEREAENLALLQGRAAVDSEMEVLSRLRRNVEEELQTLMSNKVEISHEKERLSKLRKDAEIENQEITRLQYELEVERKALSMARSWAEEEARRARDQAKALEEARERWAMQGIKVVVDDDLREEENAGVTWMGAGKEFSVEGTIVRGENLVDRLTLMANDVRGRSRNIINRIIQKMLQLIEMLKEWILKVGEQARELKDNTISKMSSSLQEVQRSSGEFSLALKGGIKRAAEDCRVGVEKITQKFNKT